MVSWAIACLVAVTTADSNVKSLAKTYVGSDKYPTPDQWRDFNTTVGGKLIAFRHPGEVCYGDKFRFSACTQYRFQSANASFVRDDPFMINFPYFANDLSSRLSTVNSSTPSTMIDPCPVPSGWFSGGDAAACKKGRYPDFAVAVRGPEDVSKTLKFAASHGLRVNIKNTGHDFMGRNVGVGALTIWTRYLEDVEWIDNWNARSGTNTSSGINGSSSGLPVQAAIRYGSGHTWNRIGWEASKRKHLVVTGAEGSVGAGGGWLQGGGHGPFSVKYGLGVENVLELEVVTPSGDIVTANKTSHPDLFWALRGGGPSTFGIITKVAYKAHPRPSLVSVIISFLPPISMAGLDYEKYYRAITYMYAQSHKFNDFGMGGYPMALKFGYSGPFVAANRTVDEVQAFLDPIKKSMVDKFGVLFSYTITSEASYIANLWPDDAPSSAAEPAGRYWVPQVTRIFSRKALQEDNMDAIYDFVKTSFEDGAIHHPFPNILGKEHWDRPWDFALNPAWRTGSMHIMVTHSDYNSLEDVKKLYERMGEKYLPSMDKLSENHAAYINEAWPFEKNGKATWYGSSENYEKLLSIKRKYDPDNILWCKTCVGGDVFIEGVDGRLLKQEEPSATANSITTS